MPRPWASTVLGSVIELSALGSDVGGKNQVS